MFLESQLKKAEARVLELEEEQSHSQRRLKEATEEQERRVAVLLAEANARTQEVDLKAASFAEGRFHFLLILSNRVGLGWLKYTSPVCQRIWCCIPTIRASFAFLLPRTGVMR